MTLPSAGRPFGQSQGPIGLSTTSLSAALAGAGAAAPTVLVAREAITDARGEVFAYELHLQNGLAPSAGQERAPDLVAAVIELGVERLGGKHPVLLAVTPTMLRDVDILELTGDQVGFVLRDYWGFPEAVARVERLAAAGRIVVLADYRPTPVDDALLPHASLVTIDVSAAAADELDGICKAARANGARLVAYGIASAEDAQRCREAGFEYMQGDTHSRPATVSGKGSRADQMATLTLLTQLSAASTSVDDLERIVASDLGLTVSVLHAVNSAAIALPNRITSIRQAIVLLGARAVHALASLLAMTDLSAAPIELSRRALVRASMCEALALSAGADHGERFFTAGMLSMADELLDLPLDRVVAELPLSDDIADGLVAGVGEIGRVLTSVVAYERAHFDRLAALDTVARRDVAHSYVNAIAFADELTSAIEGRRAA
jgi:c-di-GMP-related signal transduction protein